MSRLQKVISDCDRQMEESHSDFSRVASISAEKQSSEARLASLEEQWLDLSEKIESAKNTLIELGRSL
jgi:hypothetical protein